LASGPKADLHRAAQQAMGWTPPDGIEVPEWRCRNTTLKEASVGEVITIGLDLAKSVFQAHGADASGGVVFRKKLRRGQLLAFFAGQPRCLVAMEACASSHYWAREIAALGHETRLIPPAYVKPFVKRQKNDAADAEAICEAAQRPTMRFVMPKSAEAQAAGTVFRTRDLLVRQRTQLINALRGHLAEFGMVVRQGAENAPKLIELVMDPASDLPREARSVLEVLAQTLQFLQAKIAGLDVEITRRARNNVVAKRLMTIPGVGAVVATALVAMAPAPETFRRGRDFSAWLGLTPLQRSSGGKERLGKISKMGERSLRRLLIIGASSAAKAAAMKGAPADSWLGRMLSRKPRMLVVVALANKMARIAWALMAHGGIYRAPAAAA
jgi:transposase